MKFINHLLLATFLLLPLPCFAQLPPQLINDFATRSGYLIMPIGDEYLIDLDASTDLQEGDILTLIVPGETVIHPITKAVLGSLDIPKGYLQVTRIKSGYSYAKLLSTDITPKKGDQVKRFEQVPAVFSGDDSAAATAVYEQLKSGLPQLNWLNNSSSTEALLNFKFNNSALSVETTAGTSLKNYPLVNGVLLAPKQPSNRNLGFSAPANADENKSMLNKTVNNFMDSVGLGSTDKSRLPAGIIRNNNAGNNNVWFGPALTGNPVGIAVADFDGDGQQETAIVSDNNLLINRIIAGKQQELAKVEVAAGFKILSLDSFDLDNNNQAELYLTVSKDLTLSSMVIEFNAGSYQQTISDIPWFLRVSELSGEGKVLLGQSIESSQNAFAGQPFRIVRNGAALAKGPSVELPSKLNIFNFLPFSGADAAPRYAYLTSGDYLKVITGSGEQLWESGDYFGGSETSFYNQKASRGDLLAPIYMPQRILRTTAGDILCAQNDGLRTMQRYRSFKDSRVVALRWNGYAMTEQWRTSSQQGYLADFALADADNDGALELVLAMKFQSPGLFTAGRSTIVIYELN